MEEAPSRGENPGGDDRTRSVSFGGRASCFDGGVSRAAEGRPALTPAGRHAMLSSMRMTRRLSIVLPEPLDAPQVRDALAAALRRRKRVWPCTHGETCVCRRSSTALRYGRRRPDSHQVRVRVPAELAARVEEMAARADVPISQAVRDLLGV